MNETQLKAIQKREMRRLKRIGQKLSPEKKKVLGHKHMGLVDDDEYGPAIHLGCRPWEIKFGV